MSSVITSLVEQAGAKISGGFDGAVRIDIEGEGSLMIDQDGARECQDDSADCVLKADLETFKEILAGETSSTSAYFSGKLVVEGDMAVAMRLGSILG